MLQETFLASVNRCLEEFMQFLITLHAELTFIRWKENTIPIYIYYFDQSNKIRGCFAKKITIAIENILTLFSFLIRRQNISK